MLRHVQFVNNDSTPIILKAAHLLHGLATSHALLDGNKRTAFSCTLLFLRLNGYSVSHDFTDYENQLEFLMKIADSTYGDEAIIEEIINWLHTHISA